MTDDVLLEAEMAMERCVDTLKKELATLRTGRAHPGLVEHIRADYFGVPTPLYQMATITVPEPRLLVVQPWDRQSLGSIEKAILKSDLGITPISDGHVVRLTIPQLTEERRRELVRLVHRRLEEGRVAIRNTRRDAVEQLRRRQRSKEISEDEEAYALERLQAITDGWTERAEETGKAKEAELLKVEAS